MSKESFTSVKDRAESGENLETPSAEDLKAQFDAPAYTGTRPNGESVTPLNDEVDWIEAHTYAEDKYRLTSEDLVESRMVISPYVTGEPQATTGSSHQVVVPAQKPTGTYVKDGVVHEVWNTQEDLPTSAEQERRTNLFRRLGRAAMKPLGFFDRKAKSAAYKTLVKLYGRESADETKAKIAAHREKYADKDGDSWLRRRFNAIRRRKYEIAGYTPVAFMGAIALERLGVGGAHLIADIAGMDNGHRVMSLGINDTANSIDIRPNEIHIDSTMVVAGGFGQGDAAPIDEVRAKGYENGINVEPVGVKYPGQMGLGPGEMTMDQSGDLGEADMYNKYLVSRNAGMPTHLVGYSEGSLVAVRTANRIAAENGGVLPADVKVTLIGSPYSRDGIGNSIYGKAAAPITNAMGIVLDERPPAGTEIIYMDTDPYANAANMKGTTLLKNLIGLGVGAHQIPDQANMKSYTFTDTDGIIHTVYSGNDLFLQALEAQGLHVADMEHANAAMNAFFPIGKDGQPVPSPDIKAGLAFGAIAIDNQIAESMGMAPGSIRVAQDIVANMPPELKDLGQAGFDAVNNISELGAKIAAGQMDPLTGFGKIMGEVQGFMGKFGNAVPNPSQGHTPVNDWVFDSAANISRDNGVNLDAQFKQMHDQVADHLKAAADQWKADQAAQAQQAAPTTPDWGAQVQDAVKNIFKPPVSGNTEVPVANDIPTTPIVTEPATPPRAAADVADSVGVPVNPIPTPPKVEVPTPEQFVQNAGKQANNFFQNLFGGGKKTAPQAPVVGEVPVEAGMAPAGAPAGPAS